MSVTPLRNTRSIRERVSEVEWEARVELAAAYRGLAHYGVAELTYNHLSLRVPDQPDHFVHLARALVGVGEPELALRTLEKAALLDPDDPDLMALRRSIEDDLEPR